MRCFLIFLSFFFLLFPSYGQSALKDQALDYRQEGYKLQAMGDLAKALSFYQKAFSIDSSYVEACNDIGVVYEAMGNTEEAVKMYKKSLEINPNYLPAYTNLAFFYEKKGDIDNATYYWRKRYELGQEGEYWYEVSKQHLLILGTYPKVKKDIMERDAIKMSQELVEKREQTRLQIIEEAKLRFDIGVSLFTKGDYNAALTEFNAAKALNPSDEELNKKIVDFSKKTARIYSKQQAISLAQQAIDDIKRDDFLSAGEKLKGAFSALFSILMDKTDLSSAEKSGLVSQK